MRSCNYKINLRDRGVSVLFDEPVAHGMQAAGEAVLGKALFKVFDDRV